MQTVYPDAYNRFKSLDDIYYYGGQNAHNVVAVLPHKPASNDQIQVKTGDLIGIAGNHWDGFSKGKNLRTNVSILSHPCRYLSDICWPLSCPFQQNGLVPSFKVNNKVEVANFPKYSHVDEM